MGYFSNGTEGEDYQDKWCRRCLHDNFEKGIYCPILALHMEHNYDEANKPNSFLNVLIPRTKDDLDNERCAMFVDRGLLSNLAIQKFESDISD